MSSSSETYLPPNLATSSHLAQPGQSNHGHGHGQGHARNASTYTSAENGVSTRTLTQRSPSPSPTKPTFGFGDHHLHSPIPSSSGVVGSSSLDRSSSGHGVGLGPGGPSGLGGLTPQRIGRAIGARFMRAVRRGNLPFLIVFFSCTIVFFSALAGVGYVEPPLTEALVDGPGGGSAGGAVPFKPGGPVFDPSADQRNLGLEKRIAEQRALEEAWARKRRPKDGAWMRKQRDDKAVRRVPTATKTTSAASAYETVVAELVDTGDDGAEGLDKRV
ncbi:hypothetical protein CI109_105089 [Kwoniella shandongensis]|uniref:Uncharacterized protein n=1 Tax=Kwoniella shandongensis TaxID=1734106 RepID=A0A5M6BY13_9TREE|nr:uncharacterized protein CI109_004311 [Kwoniella shandongensis]KAA5527251.1 hypothetical protein CI109_004311 [Kwoniella shandongensis]